MENPGKILFAYNGCRFYFILLLKQLLTQNENLEVNGLIENNGRIMQYLFNECKMFDLCNFTLSTLDEACKDNKISQDKCKSSFKHENIKNLDDVEFYRNEVVPYLELDLISMKEIFYLFNSGMYKLMKVNITSYLTISSLSYKCWISYLHSVNEKLEKNKKIKIEIPDKKKI